jgi:YVTN family beta-propeller protein
VSDVTRKPPTRRRRRSRRPRLSRRRRLGLFRLAALIVGLVALISLLAGAFGGGTNNANDVATQVHVTGKRAFDPDKVPALVDPHDVYAADRPGMLSPVVRKFPSRVYVPNSESNTVSVINPQTYKVIDTFPVGELPQHVVPSYDLKTLWVNNDNGNSLTPINPATGKPGGPVLVTDPYNLYFTPDGRYAIVVEEREQTLDFRDAHTMHSDHSLSVPCNGVNHMDFSADGRFLLASCEFGGNVIKVDLAQQRVVGTLTLQAGGMPQDVKLSPDGKVFYVADMQAGGVWLVDAHRLRKLGFIPTGDGAHGLYVSRDSKYLYVSNRMAGSVSVISFATRKVVDTWQIPGGGSPDMGGVSADGKVLWLSGRYNAEVYAFDTGNGKLLARIPVGNGPHGLCVYPQPGRYSLGHTGVFR